MHVIKRKSFLRMSALAMMAPFANSLFLHTADKNPFLFNEDIFKTGQF